MSAFPVITELVPHARPMLAVEELSSWSPGRATVRMTVRPDGLFVRDGVVDTLAALEFLAQGVAACLGYEAFQAGGTVRVGMVIACRAMTIERTPLVVGEELSIHVQRVRGADWLSHFDAQLDDATGERVARATLTLVHADAPPEDD